MEDSDDSKIVEEGVRKFVEWIRSGKIEVRINIVNSFVRRKIRRILASKRRS
jgi:hypothetical protein